ncbi:MAG: cytochrome b N-terminal domain-containing protein [Desulfovibrio sp.]|jgi:quinol-cytochrome oxidoreductase complex cytochrome b subunit|nr:cytochrome b N-terminal domain-containing protein [Desulfovibrio sp.]
MDRECAPRPAGGKTGGAGHDLVCFLGRSGGLVVLVFLFQAASGIYMAMFFQPTPADAWTSVEFIETQVRAGGFFRSLHRWGAFVLMSFLTLHLLIVIFRGAWRRGGRKWCTGILLLALAAAFTVTGYLLPWDFRAYWTVKTIGHWIDGLPLFAGALQWLLFSDTVNGVVPVGRWFALHTLVLPLLAGVCLGGHFPALRGRPGFREKDAPPDANGPAHGDKRTGPARPGRFFSGRFPRAAAAVAGTTLLLLALAAFGIQKQDFADPVTTSSVPQPDWLYMMFFQVTRYFQEDMEMLGVFWIPALLLLGLCLLPLADRGNARKKRIRWLVFPVSLTVFLAFTVVTYHTCSTTPIWSCASCHKKDFGQSFAAAPRTIDAFSTRHDNKWLALHYRFPQYFWMMDADAPSW